MYILTKCDVVARRSTEKTDLEKDRQKTLAYQNVLGDYSRFKSSICPDPQRVLNDPTDLQTHPSSPNYTGELSGM